MHVQKQYFYSRYCTFHRMVTSHFLLLFQVLFSIAALVMKDSILQIVVGQDG